MTGHRMSGTPVPVPFTSVEDAIARRGDERGLQFFDDLAAAHPNASAVELAKLVLSSLGVAESAQKVRGVRTRYGNDVQALAARVREARKRATSPHSARPIDGGGSAKIWAGQVEAFASRDPAYLAALIQALRQAGHLDQ